MVSYKKLYEELKEQVESTHKMGWKCPRCGNELLGDYRESEIFCENKNCGFDKIVMEVMYQDFFDKYDIEDSD